MFRILVIGIGSINMAERYRAACKSVFNHFAKVSSAVIFALVIIFLTLNKSAHALEAFKCNELEGATHIALTKNFDTSQLSGITVSPKALFGNFTQGKFLSDFGITVKSEGRFEFLNGEEIHWITTKPIENRISISPTQILSQQNGQEVMQLSSDDNPVVAILSDVFLSVLTAKWQQLDKYFDIQGGVVDGNWLLLLTPNDESFKQVFTHLEIEGSQYIQSLRFFEHNGDKTTICFEDIGIEGSGSELLKLRSQAEQTDEIPGNVDSMDHAKQ